MKMGVFYNILLVLSYLSAVFAFHGKLHERFGNYETLHHTDIRHNVVKRSVQGSHNEMVFTVDTLGKHFKLHLRSARGLFAEDFTAYVVDKHKQRQKLDFDTREFYEGFVDGDPESLVHAYWEGNELVTTIETKEDTYVIEPSWRHLPTSDSYSMISYRKSDMKKRAENDMGESFCGFVHPDRDDAAPEHFKPIRSSNSDSTEFPRRHKRQSSSQKVCPVALVADYKFYQGIGGSDESTTVNYVAKVMSSVNRIFIRSEFGSLDAGFYMQIRLVEVHTAPTTDQGTHYNMERNDYGWNTNDLLMEFSKENWEYCLAHLFTHQPFEDGVLGLGWVASATPGTTGGICSTRTGDITYNTAWSSTLNSARERLTVLEANLVTAHEFGHNWGSPHDPGDCTGKSGGNYLMYQYSVNGYDDNNNDFSSCSKTTIQGVLSERKDDCFIDPDAKYCGNGVVEDDEQCDAGSRGLADDDRCCSTKCKFKAKYRCSDVNDVCCENCLVVPAEDNKQCRSTGSSSLSCLENAFCSGSSKDCPDSVHRANYSDCGDEGSCMNGECLSFCEQRNQLDCQCEDLTFACKRCCRDNRNSQCVPINEGEGQYQNHKDGKPCVIGICNNGVCDKKIVSVTERTWDVINFLTENGLAEFFRSNIVLTVVILSLLIYIPFVIVILIIDWRNDKEDDELTKEWYNKESDKLVLDNDDHVIRPTYTKRRALNFRSNRNRDEAGSELMSSRASASGVHLGEM